MLRSCGISKQKKPLSGQHGNGYESQQAQPETVSDQSPTSAIFLPRSRKLDKVGVGGGGRRGGGRGGGEGEGGEGEGFLVSGRVIVQEWWPRGRGRGGLC